MTLRRRLLLVLASLAAHAGAIALMAFASSASLPTALFIVLSELEPTAIATGPRQARANAGPPPASPAAAPSRPAPPGPPPSAPPKSVPDTVVAPVVPPAPTMPPEREAPPAPASRVPEPVTGVSVVREHSTVDAPRSSAVSSTVEGSVSGPASPRGSDISRGGAVSDGGAGSGAPQRSVGGDGAGANVAVAPSGARGGEPGTEYGPYLSRMRGRIQEALRYPPAARRLGLKGTVLVEILIRADGAITGVSVTSSSSHRLLDDAALEAIRSLSPQPFPAGVLPRPLSVQLPVVFDLQ